MNNEHSSETNPYVVWRLRHPVGSLDPEIDTRILQWNAVTSELLDLFDMFDDVIEPWIKGQSSIEPDLVALIAGYGHVRTVTGDWEDLPINIPADELDNWEKNSGLVVTIEQLHDYQAGVAGCIPEILHADQGMVIALIKKQLSASYEELEALAAKPITDFAPTQWDEEDEGLDYQGWEIERLDRIFNLYEKLWCFEQGIEELRMLMITEDDPEFHLPNVGFYEALKSINSHELMTNLANAEPKLREILKLWSHTIMRHTGKPYHRPYDNTAPEIFWWRHKKVGDRASRRPQNNGRNGSQNNRRTNNRNRRSTK